MKLIVHETYQGKRKSEDVFAAVFLSNAAFHMWAWYVTWPFDENKPADQCSNFVAKTAARAKRADIVVGKEDKDPYVAFASEIFSLWGR